MMNRLDTDFRRGLASLLGGIAFLIFANFVLLLGLLIGPSTAGGAGGFAVAGLAFAIAGIVIVLVGAAMLAVRPRGP